MLVAPRWIDFDPRRQKPMSSLG